LATAFERDRKPARATEAYDPSETIREVNGSASSNWNLISRRPRRRWCGRRDAERLHDRGSAKSIGATQSKSHHCRPSPKRSPFQR